MSDLKYEVSSEFILREIADEAVLVPVGAVGELENCIISLNETYHFIWKQFQTPHTIDEVAAAAGMEYEDPNGVMDRQIREASQELIDRLILKVVDKS